MSNSCIQYTNRMYLQV